MTSLLKKFKSHIIQTLCIALSILLIGSMHAAEANLDKAIKACNNISAQQRQMAKAAGYDLDELCSSVQNTTGASAEVSNPQVVLPREQNQRAQTGSIEQSFNKKGNLNQKPATLPSESDEDSDLSLIEKFLPEEEAVELQQFGYDLFDGVPTTFAPATDVPVTNDYLIGPGDTINVQLFGKESNSYSLVISRDGTVQFPELGPISLAGLTYTEMKDLLNERVSKQMIGVQASITMGELRSIRVFILGDANRPGSYTVSSLTTITNALFVSGGVSKIGSLRNIQLKRRGEVITTLDLYDLLLKGDTRGDARLMPGDVIFIPPIGKTVAVTGEVKRPAIYELKTETKIEQLLTLAGGYVATAYPQIARIERINNAGARTVVDIDLSSQSGKQTKLMNGDLLEIHSVLDNIEDTVMLEGHVYRPGGFSFKSGMRISDLITDINLLQPIPDLDYSIIVREKKGTREIEVLQFSLRSIIENKQDKDNLILTSRDRIIIFSAIEERLELIEPLVTQLKAQEKNGKAASVVEIAGAVKFPGEYPMTLNMDVEELINAGGGLKDSAYTESAEITRKDYSNSSKASIKHITVTALDSEKTGQIHSLEAGDALTVQTIPNYQEKLVITLRGEVKFPGIYEFYRGETLTDIIKRAGGFTELAHVEAAFFSREELRKREAKQLDELNDRLQSDIAAAQLEDANSQKKADVATMEILQSALEDSEATGRLVVDLTSIWSGDIDDIQLRNGDALIVPTYRQEITIIGEVQNPTSHLFGLNLDHKDYIDLSGGTTEKADESRIYVIKADGSVFLPEKRGWFKDDVLMEPGDTVVVPLDTDRLDNLTLWSTVSQIVYQMALGAAAIKSF